MEAILRLGLLGGTFDPIHFGHLKIAEIAIQAAQLDSVSFVTSVNPPHKSECTNANLLDRHAMVALALSGNPRMIPSSIEYGRAGKSYSVDTLLDFRQNIGADDKIFFLIGMDAFLDLDTWKDYRQLPRLCSFIVFPRAGHDERKLPSRLTSEFKISHIDSTQMRVDWGGHGEVVILRQFDIRISSTDIRTRVRSVQSIHEFVPSTVEEYIAKTKLYLN